MTWDDKDTIISGGKSFFETMPLTNSRICTLLSFSMLFHFRTIDGTFVYRSGNICARRFAPRFCWPASQSMSRRDHYSSKQLI